MWDTPILANMTVNLKSFTIFLVPAILSCAAPQTEINEPINRPNIIYILADDLGYGDLGCYNPESRIRTPHLDHLAEEGMRFTDAHAPASVCTPTRYAILTGRYCWRSRLPVGVLRGYGRALIDDEQETVAEMLKAEGYHTGVVGKWHLGLDWVIKKGLGDISTLEGVSMNSNGIVTEMDPNYIDFSEKPTNGPLNHGFDYSYILPASLDMDPYCFLENDALTSMPSEMTEGNDLNTGYIGAFWRAGRIAPDFEMDQVTPRFADKAVQFIERAAQKESPFFLYVPFPSPHTPWVPTEEFKGRSNAGPYGDFTMLVDSMVGRILGAVENLNLTEETMIVFTSDNGPFWTPALTEQYGHRAAGLLRGMKADSWEGGHKVPYIVRWPGKVKSGTKSDTTISLSNFYATCADVLGRSLGLKDAPDSHSIWPVLSGNSSEVPGQEAIVMQSSKNFFAVRKGDWKWISGLGSGGFSEPSVLESDKGGPVGQLYNLRTDPAETQNTFQENLEKVNELQSILEKYRQQGHSR